MGNFNLAPTLNPPFTHLYPSPSTFHLTSTHLHSPSIRLHLPPPAANHLKKVKT